MQRSVNESSPGESTPGAPWTTLVALTRDALGGTERDVLVEHDTNDAWTPLTNRSIVARAEAIALALRDRGLDAGDRVAIMSANRADWIVANLGILFAGCVTVPMNPTLAFDHVVHILTHAGPRAVFVDTPEAAARLGSTGIAPATIVFDAPAGDPASLRAFVAAGERRRAADPGANAAIEAGIAPGDLATLIYTSGTTGIPKGVMLSHNNIASTAIVSFGLVRDTLTPGDRVLSILPFAHIYENTNVFGYFWNGAVVYVNRGLDRLVDDLRAVRPVAMFAVPRVFERTLAGILANARAAGGTRAMLVPWALAAGLRFQRALHAGESPGPLLRAQFALAQASVLGRVRGKLGCDRLRYFVSGGATLHLDVTLTFAAAGIRIMEGYGLTECSSVVTVNRPAAQRFGTVGRPIPHVDIAIGSDGEIAVHGPNVMLGYYRQPEATAAVLRDGWFSTGDIGEIDRDGYLRVVDRKKDVFKTSGGRYVVPTRVENAIARSRYVAQAVVIGNGRSHPAALIVPNWAVLRADLNAPAAATNAQLAARSDVRALLIAECRRETRELAEHEQVRWVGVLARDLTIDDGELTPTLKVRRRIVEERYAGLVPEFAVLHA